MDAQKNPPPPVPWDRQLRAIIACGYRCGGCRRHVFGEDERRVVRLHYGKGDDDANLRVMCLRCAAAHDELQDAQQRLRSGKWWS